MVSVPNLSGCQSPKSTDLRARAGLGLALLLAGGLAASIPASAQTIAPAYAANYSLFNLNSVPGVPVNYGGLTLEAGSPNTLLIGGSANGGGGGIYSIGVTRDAGNHITGFTGTASLFATAPNIDGGLAYAPNGDLLYTAYPSNQIGEIKPGSTSPDKIIPVAGVTSSVGSLQFVPSGFAGAGGLAIASFNGGGYYTTTLGPDGSGTYDLAVPALRSTIGNGPEGLVFIPAGNPGFAANSALVSEYGTGDVAAYTLDASGVPIVGSRSLFVTGLSGAEGAFTDPLTGDFLFSTYGGGNQVIEVRGFSAPVPEASTTVSLGLLLALGLGGMVIAARRKKKA